MKNEQLRKLRKVFTEMSVLSDFEKVFQIWKYKICHVA